jgi:hypothetical protein
MSFMVIVPLLRYGRMTPRSQNREQYDLAGKEEVAWIVRNYI